MESEDRLDAKEHYRFAIFVLSVFNKSFENVVAFVGDKCSTNKAFEKLPGCDFIGCSPQWFNLVVRNVIKEDHEIVDSVRKLVEKLKNLIPSAKHRDSKYFTA